MITNIKIAYLRSLYNFFLFVSLTIFFFSTIQSNAKAFDINNIEISRPFELNFSKNKVIDDGFKKAFLNLLSLIVNSSDRKKISSAKLNEIKGMVETFSIKEEKFINNIYFVNLGVSFNKKKVFNFLEKNNIFPSVPLKKDFLFIPIIIEGSQKDILIFSNNKFFEIWNENKEIFHLINYILPTEDLEDYNTIKKNYDLIEEYDFKDIIKKYSLENSIVTLIFRNENDVRVLSRITIKDKVILKNESFSNIDINNSEQVIKIINNLKLNYEDYWKDLNIINTSIKLNLNIKVDNIDNLKIKEFEKILDNSDLVYNYYISKFDKNFIFYKIIFNGTPNSFLKTMSEHEYEFDTQNKLWVLK
tara:strand:- start:1016 stop:2095 length:1080 start_codon:yes stop_codon:yes gene_type:complete